MMLTSELRAARSSVSMALACVGRRSLRHRRSVACLVAVGLATQLSVAADPAAGSGHTAMAGDEDERVVALNDEGSALYAAGDYRRAAERFLQAYAIDEDPNLLFNIASCYEALGDIDAALEKYRAFLAAPNADAEGRPRAEQAIARLVTLEGPAPSEAAPEPPAPLSPPPTPLARAVGTEPSPGEGAWIPWLGLAGGVALGAVGAIFYVMGTSDHSEVTGARGFDDPNGVATITRERADDLVRSGDTKKAIGATSFSVGGALIAGSIIWWLVDPLNPSSQEVGLAVTLNPSEPGIHYRGVF